MSTAATITIRRATADDIDTLRGLAAAIWNEYYPPIIGREQVAYMLSRMYSADAIRHELASGVSWRLAADASGSIGYLSYGFDPGSRAVTLHKLYVLPRLHGRGIGRRLLDHLRAEAVALGARTVVLQVNKRNHRAIRLYERAGFQTTSDIVSDIGGGFVMDDYEMRLDLAGTGDDGGAAAR